jgi:competence protein ComEA
MRRIAFVMITFLVLAAPALAAQARQGTSTPPPATAAAPLDLNTATVAQLQALPGIGPRTAQLIVEHRQKNGGFKKVEELMNIKGIGEKSFLKIKPLVTVGASREKTDGQL